MKFIDITGKTFGRLYVIKRCSTDYRTGIPKWLCKCSCGTLKFVIGTNLRHGLTKSCGCLQRERASESNTSHGERDSVEYKTWCGMRQRCSNPKAPNYACYGGRGIKVCKEWESFPKFLADMGKRPSKKHTIERINNSLGYEPKNCAWVLVKSQARNRRDNHNITINGETHCLVCWCEFFDQNYDLAKERINRLGWDPFRALTTPPKKKGQ